MRTSSRPRGRRAVAAAISTLAALSLTGAVAASQAAPQPARADVPSEARDETSDVVAAGIDDVRPVTPPTTSDEPPAEPIDRGPRVLAVYDGVDLLEPVDEPLAIGFHQAGGSHPALTPVGNLVRNDNPRGTETTVSADGPDVFVMPSRGRGGSGTSAVDIAVAEGATVHAIVTGTVTDIHSYSLYGRSRDVLVEIQPTGRPDLRVMMFHLEGILVNVGDDVYAGHTPIAEGARELPVTNQVDRFIDGGCPCRHVDVRIRRV